MPSILEVSRELLKRARRSPPGESQSLIESVPETGTLEARILALEENEQRQAELVTTMADQLAQLTTALTALHGQMRRLVAGQIVTAVIAIVAIVIAMR
jgi:flagellar biosynthesis/type III secretory pathway protein FliH